MANVQPTSYSKEYHAIAWCNFYNNTLRYVLISFSKMRILSLREVRCMSGSLSWWVVGLGFELTLLWLALHMFYPLYFVTVS